MAPCPRCGLKMRTLLLGVILTLLAVVQSSPLDTWTQIPSRADVVKEAETDGYLVEGVTSPPSANESPKTNATAQPSQQPIEDSDVQTSPVEWKYVYGLREEGSGDLASAMVGEFGLPHYTSTAPSVTSTPSATATLLPFDIEDITSGFSSTSDFMSTTVSTTEEDVFIVDNTRVPETTEATATSFNTQSFFSGSGDGWIPSFPTETYTKSVPHSSFAPDHSPGPETTASDDNTQSFFSGSGDGGVTGFSSETSSTTSSPSNTEATPTSEAAQPDPRIVEGVVPKGTRMQGAALDDDQNIESGTSTNIHEQIVHDPPEAEPSNAGHSTPGWIIILGFLVGLAVLVLLCVAVATKDKWNRPNQVSQPEAQANSSNKQTELEMETLMHKEDQPRENGKPSEYVIVPVEELPNKYSSH